MITSMYKVLFFTFVIFTLIEGEKSTVNYRVNMKMRTHNQNVKTANSIYTMFFYGIINDRMKIENSKNDNLKALPKFHC